MKGIDLNCDLGESYGAFSIGLDEQVMPHITSANVACGWHGGDPVIMDKTVAMAAKAGVAVGAHPSFPDLLGFGRREMALSPAEAEMYIKYQLGALSAFCRSHGVKMQHVKPHGALYTMACRDAALAGAICRAVRDFDSSLIILAPVGSEFQIAAREFGLDFAGEFFADRAYNSDGSLVSRSREGALIHDPALAAKRVLRMAREGVVETITGEDIEISCVSVCVHGDNKTAVDVVRALRDTLLSAGLPIVPISELVR